MPIRIGRFAREGPPVAGVQLARASGEHFGAGVAQALGGLGGTAANVGALAMDRATEARNQALRIKAELEVEDAKLDMAAKFNALKLRVALREAEIRESGEVEPKDYAVTMAREVDQMAAQTVQSLRYPQTASRFTAQLAPYLTEQKITALNQGLKLQHAQIAVEDDLLAREEEQRAVLAATPQEQAAALTSRFGRLQSYLGRIYTADQVNAKRQATLAAVEDGLIERDSRSPDAHTRNAVIGNLRAGRHLHKSFGEQQRLADRLVHREAAQREQMAQGVKDARAIAASEADKMLTDLVAERDFATARGVLEEARPRLTDERYFQWMERLKRTAVDETDPMIRREMIPLIYNSRNNAEVVEQRLGALHGQGLIADKDMATWQRHLESRINRQISRSEAAATRAENRAERATNRAETRLVREQGDVEQRIANLTQVNGAASPALDKAAQDAKNWALEQMHDATPLYGGQTSPKAWLERNQPEILGRVGIAGRQRLQSIDRALVHQADPAALGPTLPAVEAARRWLKSNPQGLTTDKLVEQSLLLREKEAVIQELQRFNPQPGGSTPRSAPAEAPAAGGAGPNRKALGR